MLPMEGVGPTLRVLCVAICNLFAMHFALVTRCTQQKNSAGRGEREYGRHV